MWKPDVQGRGKIQRAFRNGESHNSASEPKLFLSTMGPGDGQGATGLHVGVHDKARLHSCHGMSLCSNTGWGEWRSWGLQSGHTFPAVSHVPAPPPRSCSWASSQESVVAQPAWQQLWAASCIQLTWPQSPCCGCHCVVTAAVIDHKAGKRGASSPRWGLSCNTTTHEQAGGCCSNMLGLKSC